MQRVLLATEGVLGDSRLICRSMTPFLKAHHPVTVYVSHSKLLLDCQSQLTFLHG